MGNEPSKFCLEFLRFSFSFFCIGDADRVRILRRGENDRFCSLPPVLALVLVSFCRGRRAGDADRPIRSLRKGELACRAGECGGLDPSSLALRWVVEERALDGLSFITSFVDVVAVVTELDCCSGCCCDFDDEAEVDKATTRRTT